MPLGQQETGVTLSSLGVPKPVERKRPREKVTTDQKKDTPVTHDKTNEVSICSNSCFIFMSWPNCFHAVVSFHVHLDVEYQLIPNIRCEFTNLLDKVEDKKIEDII